MKMVLVILAIVLFFIVAAVLLFFYFTGKPMYEPGMVRRGEGLRSSIVPPAQSGMDSLWNVEKDINLYHFSEGTGKNVLIVHGGPGYPIRHPWAGLQPLAGSYKFNY